MSAIQPGGLDSGDEELGTISISTGISHGEDARSCVLKGEILVFKLIAVDGLSPSAVMVGEVPSLQHEIGDDTMENGALVTEAFLASAQGTEVFTRLWSDVTSQLITKQYKNVKI